MTLAELTRDPVLQLNLLIWMTREQPKEHYRVRPLFHDAGFELRNIDTEFPLPETVIAAAKSKNIPIRQNPCPDLRIYNLAVQKEIYIEAKASSFGAGSDTSEQGRAHLLAVGPACMASYSPISQVLLSYHLPEEQCGDMLACLADLAEELRGQDLQPGSFGTSGFGAAGAALTYFPDQPTASFLGLTHQRQEIIGGLEPETDPAPLLLLLVEDDHHDKDRLGTYRQAVVSQIHASLICLLHANEDFSLEVSAQQLLRETTQGTVIYLPRRKQQRMEKLVVENIFKRIREAWKDKHPDMIRLEGRTMTINFESDLRRDDFLDWLEDGDKTKFSDKAPPPDTPEFPGMFSES